MSSLETYTVFLVKTASGHERCLWQASPTQDVQECWFEPDEMESVALRFCEEFDERFGTAEV